MFIVVRCGNCGNMVDNNKKFCNKCGQPIKKRGKFCKQCGAEIKDNTRYCSSCGADLGELKVPNTPVVDQGVSNTAVVTISNTGGGASKISKKTWIVVGCATLILIIVPLLLKGFKTGPKSVPLKDISIVEYRGNVTLSVPDSVKDKKREHNIIYSGGPIRALDGVIWLDIKGTGSYIKLENCVVKIDKEKNKYIVTVLEGKNERLESYVFCRKPLDRMDEDEAEIEIHFGGYSISDCDNLQVLIFGNNPDNFKLGTVGVSVIKGITEATESFGERVEESCMLYVYRGGESEEMSLSPNVINEIKIRYFDQCDSLDNIGPYIPDAVYPFDM